MNLIAEFLNRAIDFDRLAEAEPEPLLKVQLQIQAADYRKLAEERATGLGLLTGPHAHLTDPLPEALALLLNQAVPAELSLDD